MAILKKLSLLADRNDFLGFIRYQYERVKYYPKYKHIIKDMNLRKQGLDVSLYSKLKSMEGTHNGERCFIVATGPSLTVNDLELLGNEFTFGVNSIAKIGEKTDWRPTYLGLQDPFVYEKLESTILSNFKDNVFAADSLLREYHIPEEYIIFPYLSVHKHYMNSYKNYGTRFSDNAYEIVYDGYSITYSMIQIAVYMGFREIFLLGCDCNYPAGQKNHFIESGFVDRRAYLNGVKMIAGYKEAKRYCDDHGVKIVNCTRGGMLEVFPRKSLEEVLSGNE